MANDKNTVWLGGPRNGQPIKGPKSYKVFQGGQEAEALDLERAELDLNADTLARLDQMDELERRAAYASQIAKLRNAELAIGQLVKKDPKLLGSQAKPPRRWPIVALVAVLATMLCLQLWSLSRSTLPSSVAESARAGAEGRQIEEGSTRKGGAE